LLPYVLERLPDGAQNRLTLVVALFAVVVWASRPPQRTSWLCAAGIVLLFVLMRWTPGS
jgi:hypothetical protein